MVNTMSVGTEAGTQRKSPMMQPPGQMTAPAMPHNEAAEGPEGPNTVTLNMTPGAITLTSAQGTKQCESIGECLQSLLEMYEAASGGESGEGEDSAFQAGYGGDRAQPEQRPVGGMGVR